MEKERVNFSTFDSHAETRRQEREDRSQVETPPTTQEGAALESHDTLVAERVRIDDARGRAENLALEDENTATFAQAKENRVLGFKKSTVRSMRRAKKVGAGTAYVLGGILVTMTYLGYQTSRPVAYTAARTLDWIGRKMDRLADKMIDKNFPVLKYLINPVVSLVDALSKRIGLDKTLAEHLKKKKEDRRKLAKKLFEDYAKAQAAHETKEDQKKKREKRRVTLRGVLGDDVADALGDEFAELERDEEKSETEKTPAPPSAPPALSVESKAA